MQFVALCKVELLRFIPIITNRPDSTPLMWCAFIAGIIAFLLIMKVAGSALGVQRNGWIWVLLAAVIGMALLLAIETALRHYVSPRLKVNIAPDTLLWAGSTIGLLLIVIPLLALIMRTGYLHMVFTLIFSITAAILVIILVNWGDVALRSGGSGFEKAVDHRKAIDSITE